MEEKINIAKILKNKPEKTILYDAMRDINVSLYVVEKRNGETNIFCDGIKKFKGCNFVYSDTGADSIFRKGMQLLKPSKEMQDWEKFSWKRGDVLVNSSGFKLFFDRWANDDYTRFFGKVNLLENSFSYETEKYTLASKDENLDTLEIEKPEFKDGDIVFEEGNRNYCSAIGVLKKDEQGCFMFDTFLTKDKVCYNSEYIYLPIRLATEEEKKQLFSALAKEGKQWDSEKKMIVGLKPKVEFKPFDKVVVRDTEYSTWCADFFSHIDVDYRYACVGATWDFCIPYNEETAHLLGTTDEWKGGEQ